METEEESKETKEVERNEETFYEKVFIHLNT